MFQIFNEFCICDPDMINSEYLKWLLVCVNQVGHVVSSARSGSSVLLLALGTPAITWSHTVHTRSVHINLSLLLGDSLELRQSRFMRSSLKTWVKSNRPWDLCFSLRIIQITYGCGKRFVVLTHMWRPRTFANFIMSLIK